MLQKGCHGQIAESQAGTSKGKLINIKLLAPSLTKASIQKQKLLQNKVCKYHRGLKYATPSHCKRLFFSMRKAYISTLILQGSEKQNDIIT